MARAEEITEEYEAARAVQDRLSRQLTQLTQLQQKVSEGTRRDVGDAASALRDDVGLGIAGPGLGGPATGGSPAAGGGSGATAPGGRPSKTRAELYELLDYCIEMEDYAAAEQIKARLDELQ